MIKRADQIFLAGLCLLFASSVMAIEEPKYIVIESAKPFELRQYESMIVAEAYVDGDMSDAGGKGFSLIAGYIFGKNQSKTKLIDDQPGSEKIAMTAPVTMESKKGASEKIAMTAPVTMEAEKTNPNQWRMSFVMPSQYTLASLPTPISPEVKLIEIPPQKKAVITYTGFNSEQKTQEKAQELRVWMKSKNLNPTGEPQLARYNPPWTLPFLRRNEVMLDY
ncbi:MAG: SOUL family heme-binding protein [Pseudohongiellaceae bacterium]